MGAHFASMPLTNATHVCVGEITEREAEALRAEGHDSDGSGYYLFLASEAEPNSPIEILCRFFDSSRADQFARLIAARV